MDTNIYILSDDKLISSTVINCGARYFTSFINLPVLEIINSILTSNKIGEIFIEKVKLRFPSQKEGKIFRNKTLNKWSSCVKFNSLTIDDFIAVNEEEFIEEDYFEVIINTSKYKEFSAINQLLLSPLNSPIIIKDSTGNPLNLNLTHQFPLFWFEKYILKLS